MPYVPPIELQGEEPDLRIVVEVDSRQPAYVSIVIVGRKRLLRAVAASLESNPFVLADLTIVWNKGIAQWELRFTAALITDPILLNDLSEMLQPLEVGR